MMLGESSNKGSVDFVADRATTALLVIDELGDSSGGPLEEVLLAPTLNTARLVEAAHEAGMPVIFANDAHIPGLDRELLLWGEHGIAGSAEAQVSPQIPVQPGDHIIQKRRYSAFFQTGLRLLLDELGVRTLILTGFDTNICVQHTAADAYFNNFNIALVTDATGTFLVGTQAEGLAYQQKCYAAKLVTTDQAQRFIEGEGAL
ncbi:cysteine hydrolase family protein [Adlercreutzia murintestinalis]|uniref:cysteine hydrolase family protein n=1 Tax=Adlercreutzia murintestinalis TaxID=2941325 RepID=UPI0020414462|nr:isochorismatase family cysteine hydrolase [Adlercreutzia murintestinalis]